MLDVDKVEIFALDTAGSHASRKKQQELAEVVLALLDRDYQILLFSSNQKDNLRKEDFNHSRLKFLSGAMPPSDAALAEAPELTEPRTLWVTDDRKLLRWLGERRLPVATTKSSRTLGESSVKITNLADLVALFNPRSHVLRSVAETLAARRRSRPAGPYLVGVGGPAMSGYQAFAVDLKWWIEELGNPLVELLDLSTLLPENQAQVASPPADGAAAGLAPGWLEQAVLQPLSGGAAVFLQSPPDGAPEPFQAHFPLYISEESLVLILGGTVFASPAAPYLHASLLLEVSPRETARRLYEIPEGETFDDKFIAQYMAGPGEAYRAYLEKNSVEAGATIRIDAEKPGRFTVTYGAGA